MLGFLFASPMIEFIHISDTHFGPTPQMEIRGNFPYRRSQALVEAINSLPFSPQFIVHTGDIVNDPDEDAYKLADEVMGQLNAPVFYVSGNHDHTAMIQQFMRQPEFASLRGVEDKQAYCFSMGDDVLGVVFDAWVPEEEGPHGVLPQNQIIAFEELLRTTHHRFALFLHYPMIPIGSSWIDDYLLVKNGDLIHNFLKPYANRITGIFFGHLHRGLQLHRDGLLYSGVSSPICHFSASPVEDTCVFDPNCGLAFNHVTISEEATMVKEYSIPFV